MAWLNRHSLGVNARSDPANKNAASRRPAVNLLELRTLDPNHPVVIIEAPRGPSPSPHTPDTRLTAAVIAPYAAACDIHGIDIYPVSKPPGLHAGGPPINTDISVVGDMTRLVARASAGKPIWTTLQVAWSGVVPPHPIVFPTLPEARFMAYDAIVAGARGLFFFGGQIRAVVPWSRIFDRHEMLVAINTDYHSPSTAWVTIDAELHPAGSALRCVYSSDAARIGAEVEVEARNGKAVRLTVPAAGCAIWE